MRKHARTIGAVALTVALLGWSSAHLGRGESKPASSALSALKVLTAAQLAYKNSCGHGGFAGSAETLLAAPTRWQPYLSRDWANTVRSQYVLAVQPGAGATAGPADCNGQPTYTAYYATALPIGGGTTAFATNSAGTIWQRLDGVLPSEPFGAPATPIQ